MPAYRLVSFALISAASTAVSLVLFLLLRNPLGPIGASASGHPKAAPVAPGLQSEPGIVVYRFAADLYYANTNRFNEEILELVDGASPKVDLVVLDAGAIFDIDYSGGETIKQAYNELQGRGAQLVIADILDPVRAELDRYGITELIGADKLYDTSNDAIAAFKSTTTG